MALTLQLKLVDGLRGKADRVARVTFRGKRRRNEPLQRGE